MLTLCNLSNSRGPIKKAFILAIQISVILACLPAFGEDAEPSSNPEGWNSLVSDYFIIYYHPAVDLEKIKNALNKRSSNTTKTATDNGIGASEEICYKLDKLFDRVKELFTLYPYTPKVNIKIFKDRTELNEEYFRIFGKVEDFKSFYVNKYNTIYTSETDISDSVMIHEMAHVIVDYYFSAILPERAREILATYVDAHLEK